MGFDLRAGERLTSAWRGHCRLPDVWRGLGVGSGRFVALESCVCACERGRGGILILAFLHNKAPRMHT